MDNVTHTLFAATLARTPLGRAGRGTLAALVIASNAPDIDIVAAVGGGTTTYLEWHRGPTHGPLGLVGLGLATAGVVWLGRAGLDRWRARRAPETDPRKDASLGMLVSISMIGVLLHILMDLPTSYGTRLLSPFDWRWFAVDWLPIVDIYLLIALAAGLVFGELSKPSRRRLAAIVLAVMAANYGVRAVAHGQAMRLAPRLLGPGLAEPCDSQSVTMDGALDVWPRAHQPPAPSGRTCLIEVATVPTFASPFRWRVIAHLSNGYELHDLDVLDARLRTAPTSGEIRWRRAVRYPNQWTPATWVAAKTRTASVFLGFSRFPAARTFTDRSGTTTVRWTDMRFVGGPSAPDAPRPPNIFNVVVRLDPDGRIVREKIGR